MDNFNDDPKPGRLVLPLVLVGMIATTYTFINRVATNNDLDINTVAEQTVTTTANSTATTPAPETNGNGDSAKRAEDILKLIRARQSN